MEALRENGFDGSVLFSSKEAALAKYEAKIGKLGKMISVNENNTPSGSILYSGGEMFCFSIFSDGVRCTVR